LLHVPYRQVYRLTPKIANIHYIPQHRGHGLSDYESNLDFLLHSIFSDYTMSLAYLRDSLYELLPIYPSLIYNVNHLLDRLFWLLFSVALLRLLFFDPPVKTLPGGIFDFIFAEGILIKVCKNLKMLAEA